MFTACSKKPRAKWRLACSATRAEKHIDQKGCILVTIADEGWTGLLCCPSRMSRGTMECAQTVTIVVENSYFRTDYRVDAQLRRRIERVASLVFRLVLVEIKCHLPSKIICHSARALLYMQKFRMNVTSFKAKYRVNCSTWTWLQNMWYSLSTHSIRQIAVLLRKRKLPVRSSNARLIMWLFAEANNRCF